MFVVPSSMFDIALPCVVDFRSPRAWAAALLGIHGYLREFPDQAEARATRDTLTKELLRLWKACATERWPWFEPSVTYDNARLSQALILCGHASAHEEALAKAEPTRNDENMGRRSGSMIPIAIPIPIFGAKPRLASGFYSFR